MSATLHTEKTIFLEAAEIASASERAAFLDRACGDDRPLRAAVEALLLAHQRSQAVLDATAAPLAEHLGTMIGPYKLLQVIGEGGMGVVYMAEQSDPIQRMVALKVIKPGMDSRQVLARFEAERQALALMDHANIARVLDAGATPAGRPYFVMELVHGVPITKFCDDSRLTLRQRLELFVPVCQAIQHAHQKGIIHRDIKPSNVLVTLYDGRPVPKVIDFGVAKATEQKLTERTLFTQYGTMVGTLEYMSPEQAEMSALGVDTRSDVYSLGVLLYELLTGSTPLGSKRMKEQAYGEILRLIKEEEPPRPSTRLSDSGEALASISAQRQMEPAKLTKLVRGELDWIVMKPLEKDRNRRYETASGFAADVRRYLDDEPVEACPPSAGYRLRKFAHRRKGSLATAGLLLAAVVTVAGSLGWTARDRSARLSGLQQSVGEALAQAELLRDQARVAGYQDWTLFTEAREQAQRAAALAEAGPVGPKLTARIADLQAALNEDVTDRALLTALEKAWMAQAQTDTVASRLMDGAAVPQLRRALADMGLVPGEIDPSTAAARINGRPQQVRDEILKALDMWIGLAEDPRYEIQEAHLGWLRETLSRSDPEPWREAMRQAAAEPDRLRRKAALLSLTKDPAIESQPAGAIGRIARHLEVAGDVEGARNVLLQGQRRYPADFLLCTNLIEALVKFPPRADDAVRFATVAVALRPESPGAHLNLGMTLRRRGTLEEAVVSYRKAIELAPEYATAHADLGLTLVGLGRREEGVAAARKAVALTPDSAAIHRSLAVVLRECGALGDAIAEFRRAIELDPDSADGHFLLGVALFDTGALNEAEAEVRQAMELQSEFAEAHFYLALVHSERGEVEEDIVENRAAIAIKPEFGEAYNNLGDALSKKGRLDEALTCLRRAVDLTPQSAEAHVNLCRVLADSGRLDEAIAAGRTAIDLKPTLLQARLNLGAALQRKGAIDEATKEVRIAIDLKPDFAPGHLQLASLLRAGGAVSDAARACREAIRLNPGYAEAYCNLGEVLIVQGAFQEALEARKKGHELGSERPDWPYPSAQWVVEAERLVALDARLPEVLAGDTALVNAEEAAEYADLCYRKKSYGSSVRFFAEALAKAPTTAEFSTGLRYNAACAAALAGCGQGDEASQSDETERAAWRAQALQWLRADLEAWQAALDDGNAEPRAAFLRTLGHGLQDPDFAGVRDAALLLKLPLSEQPMWRYFWADVEGLVARASAPDPRQQAD